jgi:hypothetical protein
VRVSRLVPRFGFTRSGSFGPPVSRFQSSKVCGEISLHQEFRELSSLRPDS